MGSESRWETARFVAVGGVGQGRGKKWKWLVVAVGGKVDVCGKAAAEMARWHTGEEIVVIAVARNSREARMFYSGL